METHFRGVTAAKKIDFTAMVQDPKSKAMKRVAFKGDADEFSKVEPFLRQVMGITDKPADARKK